MRWGMPFLLEMPTVADAARLCRSLGLDFVELNASFPACQLDGLNGDMLQDMANRFGVSFTIHLHEDCDPFTLESAVRAAWVEHVRHAIRLAEAAGIPTLNMHLPRGVHITLPDRKVFIYEQYRDEFVRHLRAFVAMVDETAGESNIRLCIENTGGWRAHERAALDMLLESPHIGLTMDIGHCHGAGNMDEDYFLAHRNQLHHMHAHDAIGKRDHQVLGDGEIDLRARLALAKACGASVVLETKTVAALTESVRKLENFL